MTAKKNGAVAPAPAPKPTEDSKNAPIRPDAAGRTATVSLAESAEQPKSIAPNFAAAPPLLLAHRCWLLWRYEQRRSSKGAATWTKVPYQPNGRKASSTNPQHRWTLDEVRRAHDTRQFAGVGYVLGDHGGIHLAGADFDACLDEATHRTLPGRQEHVRVAKELGGWAELSPSGTGLHVITIEDRSRKAVTSKGVEVYSHGRFFTFTGEPVPGFPRVEDVPRASLHAARVLAGAHDTDRDDDQSAPLPKPRTGIDMKAARELLDHLPFRWCNEYLDWLRAGMALHHEFGGHEEALELWDEWSQRAPHRYEDGICAAKWETFGKPGKDEVTMRTLVRDAQATGWRAPATVAHAVLDFAVEDWLADARAERFDLSKPPPPLDWLFQNTIRNAKLTILAGAGGSSKSFFALALAAHWAAGIPFDVFIPAYRDPDDEALLLYAEEDELDLHHRFQATMRAAGFDAAQQQQIGRRLLLRSLFDLDRGMVLAEYESKGRGMQRGPLFELMARTFEIRPRLRWVLMDPLVLLHHLDENDNRSMAQMIGALGALAMEHRVAIWLVHHLSKAGAQADDSTSQQVRGASAIVDNARGLVLLRRLTAQDSGSVGATPQEARQMVRLSLPKHTHSGELPDRYFRIDEDTGAVHVLPVQPMAVPAQARRAVRQQAVKEQAAEFREATCQRALLELLDDMPLGSRAIYDAKPGGCSRTIAERVLASAVKDGLVRVEEGARGSRLHHLTSAGRERMAELGSPSEDLLS